MPDSAPPSQHPTEFEQRLAALEAAREQMARKLTQAEHERDEYRRVYLALLEAYRKLEAGPVGQKRERFVGAGAEEQLALSLLGMLTSDGAAPTAEGTPAPVQQVDGHERKKPTGRKPLPEHLPRIHVEVIPPEVQRLGLEAFERIGEGSSEVVEHRPSSWSRFHRAHRSTWPWRARPCSKRPRWICPLPAACVAQGCWRTPWCAGGRTTCRCIGWSASTGARDWSCHAAPSVTGTQALLSW